MRVAKTIKLTQAERKTLTRMVKGQRTEVRVVMRARIVLAAARGLENWEIAEEVGVTPETVGRWRSRFAVKRVDGLVKDPLSFKIVAASKFTVTRPPYPD